MMNLVNEQDSGIVLTGKNFNELGFFSINSSNAKSIAENIEDIKRYQLPKGASDKVRETYEFGKNGEELFDGIVQSSFRCHTVFVDVRRGHVYWYHHFNYKMEIKGKYIYLKKNADYDWKPVYIDGEWRPTSGSYLLNGYGSSGKTETGKVYKTAQLGTKKWGYYRPRLHQLVALFALGVRTLDCVGEDYERTLEINHFINENFNGLEDIEITTKDGNKGYHHMYERESSLIINVKGELVFNPKCKIEV
jgi:hypothetical protein